MEKREKREINSILNFRRDISPFLVHLTKDSKERTASENLKKIICDKCLKQKANHTSNLKFLYTDDKLDPDHTKRDAVKAAMYSSISFTETPLSEIHCMLDILGRSVDLEPYGFVFLKNNLVQKDVSPVLYLNNNQNKSDNIMKLIMELAINNIDEKRDNLYRLIPLFSSFGKSVGANIDYDFSWEREWRLPYVFGDYPLEEPDIFVGLCPENETKIFENLFFKHFKKQIPFIDPQKATTYYGTKLKKRMSDLKIDQYIV